MTFAIKKTVADLDASGTKEWLVASNGVLSIIDGHGLKWRSAFLGANLGKINRICVKNVDGDGRQDIFIGSDPVLYQFE